MRTNLISNNHGMVTTMVTHSKDILHLNFNSALLQLFRLFMSAYLPLV